MAEIDRKRFDKWVSLKNKEIDALKGAFHCVSEVMRQSSDPGWKTAHQLLEKTINNRISEIKDLIDSRRRVMVVKWNKLKS